MTKLDTLYVLLTIFMITPLSQDYKTDKQFAIFRAIKSFVILISTIYTYVFLLYYNDINIFLYDTILTNLYMFVFILSMSIIDIKFTEIIILKYGKDSKLQHIRTILYHIALYLVVLSILKITIFSGK